MGMFDTVHSTCPACGDAISIQSKAGPCKLNNYHVKSVPPEVARSVEDRTIICGGCDSVVLLKLNAPISRVEMHAELRDEEPGDWD